MEEIVPGVLWWTAVHPNTGQRSSSYWVPEAKAVIDALLPPDEGLDAFRDDPPEHALLSNRHHLRDAERFREEFGARIHASAPGMHEFDSGQEVEPFEFGSEPAPGVEAIEIGSICPDETALLLTGPGALSVADGVLHRGGGKLGYFPDHLLGDDPESVKRGLRDSYRALLDRDFDAILFAHGDPIAERGKERLRAFAEAE